MDMIDAMPPGLYEAVITEVDGEIENPQLVHGRYLFKLELRTLDDIRTLCANSPEDDRRFATAARVSEVNQSLYRTVLESAVRAMVSEPAAETIRKLNPNRLRFAMFSDENPMMVPVKTLADQVRAVRRPVSADNPLLAMEKAASSWITTCLDAYSQTRDAMVEAIFLNLYGSPILQSMVGLGPQVSLQRHIERDLAREATQAQLRSALEKLFENGGPTEAVLRALIYVQLPLGSVDERGFAMLKAVRASRPPEKRLSMAQAKKVLREQYLLVRLDEERAIRAIPRMLPADTAERHAALEILQQVIAARGALAAEGKRRLDKVKALFDVTAEKPVKSEAAHA